MEIFKLECLEEQGSIRPSRQGRNHTEEILDGSSVRVREIKKVELQTWNGKLMHSVLFWRVINKIKHITRRRRNL